MSEVRDPNAPAAFTNRMLDEIVQKCEHLEALIFELCSDKLDREAKLLANDAKIASL